MPSESTDGGREEGPSEGASSTPSDPPIDSLPLDDYGNRTARGSLGPLEVFAYHDYPMHPWRSPLWIGGRLGPLSFIRMLRPESRLRPFSGGRR